MKYHIIVGDWSDEGHMHQTIFDVQTNYEADDINAAYLRAVKKCKIGLHRDYDDPDAFIRVLGEYEENTLTPTVVDKLKKLGVDFDVFESYMRTDGALECTDADAAILYMEMAATQLPELVYALEEPEDDGLLVRGIGYGCFQD